jgi:ribosomal protein S5
MRPSAFKSLIVVGAMLGLPITGSAQEATVSGAVTDATMPAKNSIRR